MKPKLGVAWYRRDQWQKLLSASVDNDDLEKTYDEWERSAQAKIRELTLRGEIIKKVDVDVDALLKWCQTKKIPLNSSARARFAAERLRAEDA